MSPPKLDLFLTPSKHFSLCKESFNRSCYFLEKSPPLFHFAQLSPFPPCPRWYDFPELLSLKMNAILKQHFWSSLIRILSKQIYLYIHFIWLAIDNVLPLLSNFFLPLLPRDCLYFPLVSFTDSILPFTPYCYTLKSPFPQRKYLIASAGE